MGGGLMQLVAIGAQDVHLTGNPQISFFKVVYRRHTNFSMESIEQTFKGTPKPGDRVSCTIARNGDLVTNMWLEVTLIPESSGNIRYVDSVGHALIEYVELEIGGQRIDKHYGEWLDIWSELTLPEDKREGFKYMIGRRNLGKHTSIPTNKLYIPFQFFFCRNPGLALPLIALQYHEVKLNIKFRDASKLTNKDNSIQNDDDAPLDDTISSFEDVKLFVNYVYLDTDERQRFAKMTHEYLIDQVQHTGAKNTMIEQVRLDFNHPVKELVWVIRDSTFDVISSYGTEEGVHLQSDTSSLKWYKESFALPKTESFVSAKIQINGHDRFAEREASYFRLIQPYEHHTRIPHKHVYCYSFALNPENHQPSGTCNFSRLDNVTLHLNGMHDKISNGELLVFALSVNVLRITSGMGGLAYSN